MAPIAPVPPVADNPLLQPYKLSDSITLKHRIVYAPLTRCRAFNDIPQPLAAVSASPLLGFWVHTDPRTFLNARQPW